jgi:hypothetical protein
MYSVSHTSGDYMKTGKNASQGISWPKGTLILLGAVLLAVFLGFMLTNVAWNLAVLRQSLVGLIVGGVVLGLLIPFLLGMMVEKWAWLLGASYGVMTRLAFCIFLSSSRKEGVRTVLSR